MSAEEESKSVCAREWVRIRRDVIRPILEQAARNFKSSWPSAETAVEEPVSSAIRLAVKLEGERRQLTFLFEVTPTPCAVRVSHTDARHDERTLGEPPLLDIKQNHVQSYVDDFFKRVTPK